MFLLCSIKCLHVKGSVQEKGKTVEIPMNSNQAYETVDTRYDVGRKRGKAKEQDEAIYETPAI